MARWRLPLVLVLLLAGVLSLAGRGCTPPPSDPSPSPSAPPMASPTTTRTATPPPTTTPTPSAKPSSTPTATPPPSATPSPTASGLEGLLQGMSLEDKAGQMLMAGVPRARLDEYARRAVVDLRAGGVVLVAQNAESPQQVQALVTQLQGLAQVPLIVAINHEGGDVVHVQGGVTVFPSHMAVGATGQPGLACEIGRHSAEELAAMGINMNLAPVVDVNSEPANPVIGLRAFGDDASVVARLGAEFVRGTQASGVIAVAKHFPGHGGVAVDSHKALPVAHVSADQLWTADLAPFRAAIEAGVEAIMSAHLAVPALTGDELLPATLSRAVMTGLLRQRLGFEGLAISDDLDMKGITAGVGVGEAAVRAVEAGADVVLLTHPDSQEAAFEALLEAVRSGRLSEARIEESVRRILALKERYELFEAGERSLSVVGAAEHEALARRASEGATTVVKAQGLPLAAGQRILVISPRTLPPGEHEGWTLFGEAVRERSAGCRELLYAPFDPAGQQEVLSQALALAGEYDRVIVGLASARLQEAELEDGTPLRLVEELAGTGSPLTVVAWRLPYDLAELPEGVAAVATYGHTEEQVRAAAAVLFGELEARGMLPVELR